MLSSRQIDIIQFLYNQDKYITINQIAEEIRVSSKTIRNDLEAVKEYCQTNQRGCVVAKPNAGIKLQMTAEEWERLCRQLEEDTINKETIPDIRYTIIQLLLKRRWIDFLALERQLYAGRSAIEKVFPEVKQWFLSHNILCEKKRGHGIEITYTEFHWRIAMWQFYWECKRHVSGVSQTGLKETEASEDEIMTGFLDGFELQGVKQAINLLELEFGLVFSYEAHLQIIFLLSIGIIQTRRKNKVEMPLLEPCKVDSGYDIRLSEKLAEDLETYYQIIVSPEERAFILFAVSISDIQKFSGKEAKHHYKEENATLYSFASKLVNLMGEIINIDLKSDSFFSESLLIQLRSTIQRLKYRITLNHPLLKQVKKKYPNIFAAVYAVGVFFDKELGLEINENEMCCLALHLGGALERNISVLTACVVCNYGIGASQLLRERIERNISDLRILEVFSIRDIRKIKNFQCDFIISTLPLEDSNGGKEVVVVEHFLPAYDVRVIEDKMKQIRKNKLRMKRTGKAVQIQKELFKSEFVWMQASVKSKDDVIRQMCRKLSDAGYVTEDFEQSVLEHEEKASTALGKGVAIPHGMAKHVIRPVVAFSSLKESVGWQGREQVDMVFMLAFNLDEASGLREESIKFYSVFLDIMDSEEEIQKVRDIRDKALLVQFMNQKVRGEINL